MGHEPMLCDLCDGGSNCTGQLLLAGLIYCRLASPGTCFLFCEPEQRLANSLRQCRRSEPNVRKSGKQRG